MAKKQAGMSTYKVTLTGTTPLLLHQDSIDWSEKMTQWLAIPENKKASKAGDDRMPVYRWMGCCYTDGRVLGMPSDNLMTMLREGAAKVASGGKNGETFKRLSQSCLVVDQIQWPLIGAKGQVSWLEVQKLMELDAFADHCEAVKALGFVLWAKRAKVGQSKHVRVRPRFDSWTCSGTITAFDPRFDLATMESILRMGGQYCGLGDWRPSAPKSPGQFGRFEAHLEAVR
jgi:hypothetical protein